MLVSFFSLFASLFSVVNPVSAMPVYLAITNEESNKERRQIALKSCLFLSLFLLISFIGGNFVLSAFNISIEAMRIAGGLIILNSGYALLKGEFAKSRAIDKKVKKEAKDKDDVSITPLAIPMLAGPGSISFLIGISDVYNQFYQQLMVAGVIVFTGFICFITLAIAPSFVKLLGEAGFKSLSRIMGFIVMSIGIQYILGGITSVYSTL